MLSIFNIIFILYSLSLCVWWWCRGGWNVRGGSPPAGTQLAIDGRTLRAVLEQPGRKAAVKLLQLGLFLADTKGRPNYC